MRAHTDTQAHMRQQNQLGCAESVCGENVVKFKLRLVNNFTFI